MIAHATGLAGIPRGKRRFNDLYVRIEKAWPTLRGKTPSSKTIQNYFEGIHRVSPAHEPALCELVVTIAAEQDVTLPADWLQMAIEDLAAALGVDPAVADLDTARGSRRPLHPEFEFKIDVTPPQIARIKEKYRGVWSMFRLHTRAIAHAVYREILIVGDGPRDNPQTPTAVALTSDGIRFEGCVLITERVLSLHMATVGGRERTALETLMILRGAESNTFAAGLRMRQTETYGWPVAYRTILVRQPELDGLAQTAEGTLQQRARDYADDTYLYSVMAPLLGAPPAEDETHFGLVHFRGDDLVLQLRHFDLDESNWAKQTRKRKP